MPMMRLVVGPLFRRAQAHLRGMETARREI